MTIHWFWIMTLIVDGDSWSMMVIYESWLLSMIGGYEDCWWLLSAIMMIQYTLNSLLPPLSVYHTGSMCDISTYFFYLTNITYIYIYVLYILYIYGKYTVRQPPAWVGKWSRFQNWDGFGLFVWKGANCLLKLPGSFRSFLLFISSFSHHLFILLVTYCGRRLIPKVQLITICTHFRFEHLFSCVANQWSKSMP